MCPNVEHDPGNVLCMWSAYRRQYTAGTHDVKKDLYTYIQGPGVVTTHILRVCYGSLLVRDGHPLVVTQRMVQATTWTDVLFVLSTSDSSATMSLCSISVYGERTGRQCIRHIHDGTYRLVSPRDTAKRTGHDIAQRHW